jgi:hypothetical protein
MAKRRDWKKLAKQSQVQSQMESARLSDKYAAIDKQFLKPTHIWQIGKYKGFKVKKLPLNYLIWASENLTGKFKGIADKEVIERYKNIQHQRLAGQI